MKLFRIYKLAVCAALVALALGIAPAALAQLPGSDKIPGALSTALLIRLFGGNTNFISKVDVRVLDANKRESATMSMGFDMLAGKIRMEINAADIKLRESPEFLATMKQIGMDQITCLINPDKKTVTSICPNLKAYVELPMEKEEADSFGIAYTIDKIPAGRETIAGHSCEKSDVTVTDPKGAKQHIVIWTAADLKGIPLQVQTFEDDTTTIMRLKDVKLGRPDAAWFEVPGGMKKYESLSAIMTGTAGKNTVSSK